jgi:hypothetical protein
MKRIKQREKQLQKYISNSAGRTLYENINMIGKTKFWEKMQKQEILWFFK